MPPKTRTPVSITGKPDVFKSKAPDPLDVNRASDGGIFAVSTTVPEDRQIQRIKVERAYPAPEGEFPSSSEYFDHLLKDRCW